MLDELRRDTDTNPYDRWTFVRGRALLREYERGRPDSSPWTLPDLAAHTGITVETVRALLDRAHRDLETQ